MYQLYTLDTKHKTNVFTSSFTKCYTKRDTDWVTISRAIRSQCTNPGSCLLNYVNTLILLFLVIHDNTPGNYLLYRVVVDSILARISRSCLNLDGSHISDNFMNIWKHVSNWHWMFYYSVLNMINLYWYVQWCGLEWTTYTNPSRLKPKIMGCFHPYFCYLCDSEANPSVLLSSICVLYAWFGMYIWDNIL